MLVVVPEGRDAYVGAAVTEPREDDIVAVTGEVALLTPNEIEEATGVTLDAPFFPPPDEHVVVIAERVVVGAGAARE